MYILKKDVNCLDNLVNELKKNGLSHSEYSCNKRNTFAIATHFAGTEIREFIFLSERMCSPDPKFSWITSRKQYNSEEEFLAKIDEKVKDQIKNRKWV